jgi:hypothetical protein
MERCAVAARDGHIGAALGVVDWWLEDQLEQNIEQAKQVPGA